MNAPLSGKSLATARYNMVEQQISPWNVNDRAVLNLMATLPREQFVPSEYANYAYSDIEIPLSPSANMLFPKVEARLLQGVALRKSDQILEIGSGSGYTAALLGKLGGQVTSIEIDPELADRARENLNKVGIDNVIVEQGDASDGWESDTRFDVIAIGGSLPFVPDSFKNQLKVGGRLFCVIGNRPVMDAVVIVRTHAKEWQEQFLFETLLTPLENRLSSPKFRF
ncbi:MAG: protein-L-isoaspartate O-methyltransferase [Gammaproteobacteria bacterium]|nr:protein-L-isoaspartate O-methyltransferase [Gammaproteobacteria bacterium]